MQQINEAHWRDSARSIKFFIWDGKLAFPMILPLIFPRIWTLILALVAVIFFSILNRYGFTPVVFLRWLRSTVAGKRKFIDPLWRR